MIKYNMMNEVYARLNEANALIGKRETSLSTVYDLLSECDEIVKKMLIPEYEPVVENVIMPVPVPVPVPVPEPEPVPVPVPVQPPVQPPVQLSVSVKPKKKNPWIEFLQNYSNHHNIPYHQVLKIDGIQEKYKQYKNNSTPVPVPVPVPVPKPETELEKAIKAEQISKIKSVLASKHSENTGAKPKKPMTEFKLKQCNNLYHNMANNDSLKHWREFISLLQDYKGDAYELQDIKEIKINDVADPYPEWCRFIAFEEYTLDGRFKSIADATLVREVMAEFAKKHNL